MNQHKSNNIVILIRSFMERRLRIVKILSHEPWLLRARKKALKPINLNPFLKSVLGSITLGLIVGLVSCSSASDPNTISQNSPSPTTSPNATNTPNPNIARNPLFTNPDSLTPTNQSPNKDDNSQVKPISPETTKTSKSPSVDSKATVAINIYQANNQCSDFIAERADLPANNSLEMAVAKVIEKSNINEFNLGSYKVMNNSPTGIATIDFQVATNSKRRFISLSSCEKFNLFGSLRKTLIDNPAWQIKDVRFTEQGIELNL